MARGWVYVMINEAMPNLVKVGFTLKDTELRAQELSHTGVPKKWILKYEAYVINPREVEQKAHKLLNEYLYNKEYFKCSVEVAIDAIKEVSGDSQQFERKVDDSSFSVQQKIEPYVGSWFDTWSGYGIFEGYFLDGKRHGKGRFVANENGHSYIGEYRKDKKNGFGIGFFFSGKKYTGEWKDDIYNGLGTLENNGQLYEGEWKEGERDGKGKLTFANGDVYEGQWIKGEREGRGKLTFANGDVYEGQWIKGEREGQGNLTFANGDSFEGDWLAGQESGFGIYREIYSEGVSRKYEGNWKDGFKDGQGIETLSDGTKYDGMWKRGYFHGFGILTFNNGNFFSGEWSYVSFCCDDINWSWFGKEELVFFEKNKLIKEAVFKSFKGHAHYELHGERFVGEWKDYQPCGKGQFTDSSGNYYDGEWDGWGCGTGVIKFINGDIFKGRWDYFFLENCDGIMNFVNGDYFEGHWKEGKRNGKGILIKMNGDKIEGTWVDDQEINSN
jgi:hypothetical protein